MREKVRLRMWYDEAKVKQGISKGFLVYLCMGAFQGISKGFPRDFLFVPHGL